MLKGVLAGVTSVNGQTGDVIISAGAVSSVSNSDGTLTISPTTGDVVASLNLSHANTWTGQQTFNTLGPIFGTTTANTVPYLNGSKILTSSAVTPTELGFVSGVTANIQTQINALAGAGYVVGPASATDNAIARFDLTTGKVIQNSIVTIADTTGVIAGTEGITFTPLASPAYSAWRIVADSTNRCFTAFNADSTVAMQLGKEVWATVFNNTGSTIANGVPVYQTGYDAGSGYLTVGLASSASGQVICLGLTTESIPNNSLGEVCVIGDVHGMDTSAFTAGASVYPSSTPGVLTATAPLAPAYRYRVGKVGRSDAVNGYIQVTPSTAALGNGTANQVFGMNTAGTVQEVKSILGTANEITITNATNSITASLPSALTFTGKTITGGTFSGITLSGSTTLTGFTAGSVLFAGTSGVITQDNANFFFDDANNRLGLLTATPTHDFTLGTGADRTIKMQDSATGGGNSLTILGAASFTGGFTGGAINLTTGSGSNMSTSGNGNTAVLAGAFTLTGGSGGNSAIAGTDNRGGRGGVLTFSGGAGGTSGNGTNSTQGGSGGSLGFTAGAGGATTVTTASGTNIGGLGGTLTLASGDGGSGVSGPSGGGIAGQVLINAGAGGNAGTGRMGGGGGAFTFTAGSGGSSTTGSGANTGAQGGGASMQMGNGGAATTSGAVAVTSGVGGSFTVQAGNGGTVTGAGGTNTAGNAGSINFVSGNGGTTAGTGTPVGKDGGAINFTAGDGTSTAGATNNGGAIYLLGGAKSPSGIDGNVLIGINSAGTTRGNLGIGLASANVAAKTHILAITEQLRIGYDTSNYFSTTISSTGNATLNLVGTSPEFTFSDPVNVPDEAFGSGWDGNTEVPTKNAVYDALPKYARVTGSNATTTGQVLIDVAGLSIALEANAVYEVNVELSIGTSAVASGTRYALQYSAAGASVEAGYIGTTTDTSNTNNRMTAFNTATTGAFMTTTSSVNGQFNLNGIVRTGANAGNLTVQHLKVTSGTSTIFIDSYMKVTKIA